MSFGYSVGDVIAGANLTYRLLRIMADTKGGSQEYIDAMSELSAMQQAFLQISHIRSQKMLPTSTINAASHIVLSSMETIAGFLEKSKHYQSILENPRASQFQSSWYKVGWTLYKSHELRALRDTLHSKLTSVQVLLSAAAWWDPTLLRSKVPCTEAFSSTPLLPHQVIGENQTPPLPPYPTKHAQKPTEVKNEKEVAANSIGPDITGLPSLTEGVYGEPNLDPVLRKVRQDVPKENEEIRVVHLEDAVGRKFKFPFERVNTWAGFEDYVKQAFVQVEKLGPHVQEGRYDLAAQDGTIILPSVWEHIVEPGMIVAMTMWPMEDSTSPPLLFPHFAPVSSPRKSSPPYRPSMPSLSPSWDIRSVDDSSDSNISEARAVTRSSAPVNLNTSLPYEETGPDEKFVRHLLDPITRPELLQTMRELNEDSLITSEAASWMMKHLRLLRN